MTRSIKSHTQNTLLTICFFLRHSIAIFVFGSLFYLAGATTRQTTPHYYDDWCETHCSSLTTCNSKYGPSHVDLRIRVKFPIDDGPGEHLVFDKYVGNVINRQSFETQFILDIASSLDTSPCRIYIIDINPEGSGAYWDSENVFITFRIFPIDPEAVANLTKQIHTPSSKLFGGKVTRTTAKLIGLVALHWDFSLKLTYAISVIGGYDVIKLPQHERYLNQGSLQSCSNESNADNMYCTFERHLIQDVGQSLGLKSGQFLVLFIREADWGSVIVSFRLVPNASMETTTEGNPFIHWIESTVADLVSQISDSSSRLYSGNVTFRIDPTWGISQKSKRFRQFTKFLSLPIPPTSDDAYERCKATLRCPRASSYYNQTSAQTSHTMQTFDGGEQVEASLFLGFEDWRQGIKSWRQSCRKGIVKSCLPKRESENNHAKPIGAHFSPFDYEPLGPSVQSYGKLWNSGLVLNKKGLQKDIESQISLIKKYESLVEWLDREYIYAVTDDVKLLSRHDIRANITRYRDLISEEKRILQALSESQCINVKCNLLFNTSNALLIGAVNATGLIARTPNGTEVAIWTFDSIDIDENVNVSITGQRAMVLLSRSSLRINTTLHALPGTIGGFPGGLSVARRREDRLIRVCSEQVDTREFLDICEGKSCCPGDQPISQLASGIISNNVNGPGSPSVRVYLFTIQTSAPVVFEIQSLKTSADFGQTLSGGFRLHFHEYTTPLLPHDITAHELKARMEDSLNPSSRLKDMKRTDIPAGIGAVDVTRERFGTSGGYNWTITFTSSVGSIGRDSGLITVTNELVSKGATVSIETIQNGNSIGGTFSLRFLGNETRQIRHDASASELKDILLQDISSLSSVHALRNDAIANCNDGFCNNGPDQSGGYVWTLTMTTDVGNQSPSSPTSNEFDLEGDLEEMLALNFLSGCVESKCPQIQIDQSHAKSHNKEMRNIVTNKPFSLAYGGGGGGYGGIGGDGFGEIAPGRVFGDDMISDLIGGSGGAVGFKQPFQLGIFKSPRGRGGSGGGAIEFVATNDIIIESNGIVSVNGEAGADGYMSGGGGGSGGSIILAAGGAVHIKGKLSASGGDGGHMKAQPLQATNNFYGGPGGGGSGGRIALYGESVVREEESSVVLNGGSCSDVDVTRHCIGGEGSLFIASALDTKLTLDHSRGMHSPSSLFLHPRTIRPPQNPPKHLSLAQSGPEYDLGLSIQPGRVSFFFNAENSSNEGWDAVFELREYRWSYLSSNDIVNYTTVMGVTLGQEIRHGVNYFALPFNDEHVKDLATITPIVSSNTWTKVDIRFDWKNGVHDLYINDTWIVKGKPFHGEGIRAISISNFFDSDGVWFDEIFVGDDTSMGFHCPIVLSNGTVQIKRPLERGWKASDVGNSTSTTPMQRHESHVSKRALYQRKEDMFIAPFDGEERIAFYSDVKFKGTDGDRVHQPGKYFAGSLLRLPRGEFFDDVFMSSKTGSKPDTFFWYSEHDFNIDPSLTSGAVMACSTQDFKTWKYEGAMLHYTNLTDMVNGSNGPFHIEKPKVLYNEKTEKFVMWMIVDNGTRELGLAGVAVSDYPDGPFTFVRTLYPDGNQTRDQTLFQDEDGSAYLFRTFYQTVPYVMPEAVMQPTWESVKKADGSINFPLSFHRAEYEPGYDDYHDIYLQRWRAEDKPWNVVCINRLTGQEREVPYGQEYLNFDGEVCHKPFEYKVVLGQGNPTHENSKDGIRSRFLDPNDPENNVWVPGSVPALKGQTWKANYEDGTCGRRQANDDKHHFDPSLPFREEPNRSDCSNIVDNPIHPTLPDKRIGPETVVQQRRAKYVAISRLTDDYLDTSGIVTTYEGELHEGADLLSLVRQFIHKDDPFAWSVNMGGQEAGSAYLPPVYDNRFYQARNSETDLHQYETKSNDRSFYSPSCVYDGKCPNNFLYETI
ncbi:hypothetical protein HJC23_007005 [Cyclotella cryptica]|uniref:Uncharacterized protein n=1 Tax=Cyclotella cryptica TaxID=29204 RepID=A0ABD3QM89_9STRA|eukprot:CCRYP_004342-RA/>CCRYP_004342-RA protein AED:0.18 eAED:0.19 QI:0/-1/0/1/-1/1/1/0/1920